jgi:hypothetical protein
MVWQQTIDRLAIRLCPPEEWDAYMDQLSRLEWFTQQAPGASANLRVFPVWKKYRSQAQQLAALYQAIPVLKHLPLRWAILLGKILF